jgi:hypothetical protein
MSGQKSTGAATNTTASSNAIRPRRRMALNYLLIWVDFGIDETKKDCQNMLAQLQSVVHDVNIFTQPDQGIDFLTDVDDIKAFLLVAGTIGQQIVPLIHDISHLDSIYIYGRNKSTHEQWAKQWFKVRGVHTNIIDICESLQKDVKQCNQDSIAVSFVSMGEEASRQNLNQLEPSFMYTQIFKEILLDMEYDRQSITKFTTYCRNGDYGAPSNITQFENEYYAGIAIWWYTSPSFIYAQLRSSYAGS